MNLNILKNHFVLSCLFIVNDFYGLQMVAILLDFRQSVLLPYKASLHHPPRPRGLVSTALYAEIGLQASTTEQRAVTGVKGSSGEA